MGSDVSSYITLWTKGFSHSSKLFQSMNPILSLPIQSHINSYHCGNIESFNWVFIIDISSVLLSSLLLSSRQSALWTWRYGIYMASFSNNPYIISWEGKPKNDSPYMQQQPGCYYHYYPANDTIANLYQ